ncbi:MAG TPA: hypothetical protein ENI23_09180 [bacterium]|nr:hypothetical protein [bacterium]
MAFDGKKRCNTCKIYDCGIVCRCDCHRDFFGNSTAAPNNYSGDPPDNSAGAAQAESKVLEGLANLFG